jgi:hypothetical protein
MFDDSKLRQRHPRPPGQDHLLDGPLLPNNHVDAFSSGVVMTNAPLRAAFKDQQQQQRYKRRPYTHLFRTMTTTCLAGVGATLVSGTLSVLMLPKAWIQVDYHHQVQKAATKVFQHVVHPKQQQQHQQPPQQQQKQPPDVVGSLRGGKSLHHPPPNPNHPSSFLSSPFQTVTCPHDDTTGWINDDYCDCYMDGSDEVTTSACSNRLVAIPTFKCLDGASVIFASRVHDGVLDCHDGSDEF